MSASNNLVMAAIDIGSSAIRMDIAEIGADGAIRILDSLKKGVQLGREAFTEGHLSQETIRAACEALRDFKKVMDSYGVSRYRAVATSAVRESSNSETFLDRLLMSTGLDVEVVDGPEENRLTLSAVMDSLRGESDLAKAKTLIVEVGGGSTDIAFFSDGELQQSSTLPLGSVRLRAALGSGPAKPEQQVRLLKRQINSFMSNLKREMEIREAVHFIALGGDVRLAASILKGSGQQARLSSFSNDALSDFVDTLSKQTTDSLVQKYSIPYLDAETLVPALLTYLQLLKETQAQSIVVSDANIRAGILQDLAPAEQGKRRKKLIMQILSAARSLGRKYHYDESHAERVRELATRLFDELRVEQRMTDTHRLYLEVAALLHDIGLFISPRSHHKHSYYLISCSELFGLRKRELELIANIARYHRRAMPQRSHTQFIALDRDERMVVSKLGAILRVANALDKDHSQNTLELKISREGDQIVLASSSISDMTMGRLALAGRSDFFTEVFGKKVILREADKTE
ncbi:MAG: Ppx/GppA family phosphatase [Acidobacteria bacterium]|nr:Ppx/GppA family phosphatase [Acidobacteriota bacterium]